MPRTKEQIAKYKMDWCRAWRKKNREKHLAQMRAQYHRRKTEKVAKAAEYRRRNPDKIKAACKKYYDSHAERRRADSRARYWANPDKWRRVALESYRKNKQERDLNSKEWCRKNPEKRRAIKSDWERRNPEKVKAIRKRDAEKNWAGYLARGHKRRAVARGLASDQIEAVRGIYERSISNRVIACHYCKKETRKGDRHVDHKVPIRHGGGHVTENLVIACRRCNSRKGAMMPKDFLKRLRDEGTI